VSQNQLEIDWNNFSVSYTNLKGNTLKSTWKTPVPDYKDVQNSNFTWVRPTFTINGTAVVPESDFANAKAVIKSSSIELVNRVLRITTPDGDLSVDWSKQDPVFTLPTSVKNSKSQTLTLYPNPFASFIRIDTQEQAQLKIYDATGVTRLTQKLEEGVNSIQTDNLGKGLYIAEIINLNTKYRQVIVK